MAAQSPGREYVLALHRYGLFMGLPGRLKISRPAQGPIAQQHMPPRQARSQPLHPIYAVIGLLRASTAARKIGATWRLPRVKRMVLSDEAGEHATMAAGAVCRSHRLPQVVVSCAPRDGLAGNRYESIRNGFSPAACGTAPRASRASRCLRRH
jgi:hypothetical protein